MTSLSRWPQRVAYAIGVLFGTLLATPTWAGVIYEYREIGSSAVIGTLEIASPPASATSGWSTTDPSDLLTLYLEDSVFGLGTGNLLSGATVGAAVLSLDGSNLDVGSIDILFPLIVPGSASDPTLDQFMSLVFGVPSGSDFIGLSTISIFPDGRLQFADLFLFGDWTTGDIATVPEPSSLLLLATGGLGLLAKLRRRRK